MKNSHHRTPSHLIKKLPVTALTDAGSRIAAPFRKPTALVPFLRIKQILVFKIKIASWNHYTKGWFLAPTKRWFLAPKKCWFLAPKKRWFLAPKKRWFLAPAWNPTALGKMLTTLVPNPKKMLVPSPVKALIPSPAWNPHALGKMLAMIAFTIFFGTSFLLILAGKPATIDARNTPQHSNQVLLKLLQPHGADEFSQQITSSNGKVLKIDNSSGIMLIEFDYKLQSAQFLNSPDLELIEPLKEPGSGKQEVKVSEKAKEKIEAADKANVIISFTDPVPIGFEKEVRKFAVKHYRDEILKKISGDKFEVINKFDYVPAISGFITKEGINILESNPLVESINLVKQTKIISAESIPLIKADLVHTAPYELTGKGMTVAILDTGADTDHPDFTYDNAVEDEKCFTSDIYDNEDPPQLISSADCQGPEATEGDIAEDFHGHGTNVAGIITAPNGFAPDAGIVPIRVTNDAGFGVESDWVRALDWVIANQNELGVDTVNISMEVQNADGSGIFYNDHPACDTAYPEMLNAINQLNLLGITVFAGTGNRGNQAGISSPACLSNVIAVGATYDSEMGREPNSGTYSDTNGTRWANCYDSQSYDTANSRPYITCFSNSSTILTNIIMAPGAKIMSTNLGGGQSEWYGTSQASPVAAGIGTLMLQVDSTQTNSEIKSHLLAAGSPVYAESGVDEFKMIDAHQSVEVSISAECQNVTDVPEVECMALKRLYNSTNGGTWTNSTDWLSTNTACDWFGITCANNHVTGINLPSNNLIGFIPEELQNLKQLIELNLNENQLQDKIPGQIGNLLSLQVLDLGTNKLEKSLPGNLKNLTNLLALDLCSNKLNGEIPAGLVNLTNLTLTDIGYNKLTANDPVLISFLDNKDPDWDETQTISPSNIQAGGTFENNRITVSWDVINYQEDGGYYQVRYSETSGEPYIVGCTTADKTENSCEVTNLTPDTTYFFVVQSFTPGHGIQQNDLLSDYSSEIQATTPFVHYVTVDGNCNGALPCYSSIQSAINTANNDEMIKVATGIYSEGVNQVVQILNKGVFLAGGYAIGNWNLYAPDTNETILDAQNQAGKRVISIFGTGGYDLLIKGFTVKNGNINDNGGGVYIGDGIVTLEDSKIINSKANGPRLLFGNGGGVCIIQGKVILNNNIVQGNTAYEGGGIYVGENTSDITISGNQIRNNYLLPGGEYGGGVKAGGRLGNYTGINNKLSIKDNVIENNSSQLGGAGILIFGTDDNVNIIEIAGNTINSNSSSKNGAGVNVGPKGKYLIENNTINGNQSVGSGSMGGGIYLNYSVTATINNNEISNNTSAGGAGGIGIKPVDYMPTVGITLTKNLIRDNVSTTGGAGVEMEYVSDMIAKNVYMYNNIVVNNIVSGGGAEILANRGNIVAIHNTLSGNNNYGLGAQLSGIAQIYNSIVEGYSTAGISGFGVNGNYILYNNNVSNFANGATTNEFLEGDPNFVNTSINDYHLDASSPAIDSGIDYGISEDIDGQLRPLGFSYDLGADEFTKPTCNDISEIPTTECEALYTLYLGTIGTEWTNSDGWFETYNPCSWSGINCTPEPAESKNVISIDLTSNNLAGILPSEIQNLAYLEALLLNGNSLSGTIPSEIGNLDSVNPTLNTLNLSNNKLEGEIPLDLINLSNLSALDLGYNKLKSNNQAVKDFLVTNDSDWDQTQTVLPEDIKVRVNSDHSLKVSFQPIPYTADGGYYRVNYSTSPGGPYSDPGCQTNDKSEGFCETPPVLQIETNYYIVVQTFTPAHTGQPNDLLTAYSPEIEVFIVPDKDQLITHITNANSSGLPVSLYLSPQTHQFDLTEGIVGEEENGLPAITGNITIVGSGATITRDDIELNTPYFRIFNIGQTGKLKLEDVKIINGELKTEGGGGINNEGVLVLDSVTLSQNIAQSGGAVQNNGTLTVTNSNIEHNLAFGSGGGINSDPEANLSITGGIINENIAGSGGGGLNNTGTASISGTDIKNNLGASGGGISNGGSITLSGVNIIGNTTIEPNLTNDPGIGICNHEDPYKGGGLCNFGTLNITGSVLQSNAAISSGGALYNDSTAASAIINNSCVLSNAAETNDEIINVSTNTIDATANWWGYEAGPTPPEIVGGNVDTGSPLAASILGCPEGTIHDEVSSVKDLQTLPFDDSEFIDTDLQPLGQYVPTCATGITKVIYYQVTNDKEVAESIIGRSRIGGIIGRARVGGFIGRSRIGGIIGRARIGGMIGQDKYRLNVSGEDFTPVISIFAENDPENAPGVFEEISCSEGAGYITQIETSLNPELNHYIVLGFRDADDGKLEIKTESLHNQLPVEIVDYNLTPEGSTDTYYLEIFMKNVRDYDLSSLQIRLLVDEESDKAVTIDETAVIASILQGQTGATGNQLQVQFTPTYIYGDAVKFYVEITTTVGTRDVSSTLPIIVPPKLKFEFWDFDDEQEITSLPEFPPDSDPRYMDELVGLEEYAVRWIEDIDLPYDEFYSLTRGKGGELSEQFYNRMIGQISGYFSVENMGLHEFDLTVEDGANLLIDGHIVIDDTGPRTMNNGSVRGSIMLSRGWHKIEIQYFEDLGGNGLKLEYMDPLMVDPVVIPTRLFSSSQPAELYDFGDAPESNYPTTNINNGAKHILDGVTYLGACVDSEADGQPSTDADADNNHVGTSTEGTCSMLGDDEDGVTFNSPLQLGTTAYLEVEASTPNKNLSTWIDFNRDGDWDDIGEKIFADVVLLEGTNSLKFDIPSTAEIGDTIIRFRFSTDTGLSYTGLATDGEVEDYSVPIVTYDYGDAPDPLSDFFGNYPTLDHSAEFNWAKNAGGTNDDQGESITVDSSGNSYVTGSFFDSATFGKGETNEITLSGLGEEIFVAKYNSDGTLAWAKSAVGSTSNSGEKGYGIAVDSSGNSFLIGTYIESAIFGFGETNETILSGAGNEIFIAKYNSDGTLVWATDAGGASQDEGNGIGIDSSGNIYVTGYYNGSSIFGAGESNETPLSGSLSEIFVAKYNSSGNLVWATDAGWTNSDYGYGIAVDNVGNSYVTGYYESVALFGEGEVNEITLNGSGYEIFVAKYNSNGILVWAKDAGGSYIVDAGNGITVNGNGSSYVTGFFGGTAVFGQGEPNETTLDASTGYDTFIAKYNTNGTLAWVKKAGGANSALGYGIALDNASNAYVTGSFNAVATFGEGEPNETTLSGSEDAIYIAKYNTNGGTLDWALSVDSSGSDTGKGIDVDDANNIYITGHFVELATFGRSVDEVVLSGSSKEIFVAKYSSINPGAFHVLNDTIYMGDCVDTEPDGQPTEYADGDDANAGSSILTLGTCTVEGDDEDGVIFNSPLIAGLTETVDVKASTTGNLSAWVDFNADGNWDDNGEQIFDDAILSNGINSLSFNVPTDATIGYTYTRFRFSTDYDLEYFGEANDGEVEDYKVHIGYAYDHGDAPDSLPGVTESYPTMKDQLQVEWAKSAGGDNSDSGYAVAVDNTGNIYVTGHYTGPATFGKGEANETILSDPNDPEGNIFVTKYNSNGYLDWAKGTTGSGWADGWAIEVDAAGNIYVTGRFSHSKTFGVGEANETILTGDAYAEIFIAKYSNDGTLVWAQSAGGYRYDYGNDLVVDGTGNIYVTGNISGAATFGEGASTITIEDANNDIFIAKYSDEGIPSWVKSVGGGDWNQGHNITIDTSGNIYITGCFTDSSLFGKGEVNETTLAGSGYEIFVAKYDNSGMLMWAKSAGGDAGNDWGKDLDVDRAGNIYVTGNFGTSATFGKGEHNAILSGSGDEIFIAKYSSDGTLIWAKSAGGADQDRGLGITVDKNGNSYVMGHFTNSAKFGEGAEEIIIPKTGAHMFIAKYMHNGTLAWVKSAENAVGDYTDGIAIDDAGNLYVTSSFNTTTTFGEGENTVTLTGVGNEMFIAKYNGTNSGAFHTLDGTTYIGDCIDNEIDGQPTEFADGDDITTGDRLVGLCSVTGDDDDGIQFEPLITGTTWNINLTASTTGYLNAWLDFNSDGDWNELDEQIFTDRSVSAGLNSLNVQIPLGATMGDTYARFRLTSYDPAGTLSFDGLATDGEVEDYKVTIETNTPPAITITEPNGTDDVADTNYTITWIDDDPDNDATITLFYDTNDTGEDGTQITDCDPITEDDPADSCTWDTSGVTEGDYYVYGIIDDGTNTQVIDYSDGAVTISHAPAAATIQVIEPDGTGDLAEDSFVVKWIDEYTGGDAIVTLFYDTDNTGQDGTQITDCDPINEDDETDSCTWDTSAITERTYYIYAIINDGINPPVVDYSNYPLLVNRQGICPTSLCNGDFESATDLEYWKPGNGINQIVTDIVQDGEKSYYTEHTYDAGQNPRWSGAWQNVMVKSAQTYGLTGFYQSENAAQGHIKISWKDTSGNLLQVNYPVINMSGTNTNWIEFSKLVIAPAGAFTAEIRIWHGVNTSSQNASGSKLWIDSLTFEVATTACGTLCNESFEHGILYWIQSGAAGSHTIEQINPHEGLKILKSEQLYSPTNETKWAGVTQYAQVQEGTAYRLRLWLKTENAANGHVRIKWRDDGGGLINTQYLITGINGTTSTWFKQETNITAPVNASRAEIAIWHGVTTTNLTGSTLWVDDITLICLSLCNGGFEDGNVHWETNGTNEGEIILTDVQEGTQAIKITQGLDSSVNIQWAGVSQRLMVSGGTSYDLSFWLKKENAVQGHVKIKWRDTDDQLISTQYPIGGINGTDLTWTESSLTITAPPNAETIEIFIWHGVDGTNQNAIGSTLYLDNVGFTQTL